MGGSSQTTGWNYRLAWLHMLGMGPFDTFREFRGADKVIWKGRITGNTALAMYAPRLWGGDKDQGGVDGTLRLMFGEADQLPNAYATATWGPRTAAYRGFMTAVWEGGIWGANNPWAQKCSYRAERYIKGWDNDDPWYPETCPVPLEGDFSGGGGSPGGPDVPPEFGYNIGRRVLLDASVPIMHHDRCTIELAEVNGLPYSLTDEAYWFWRENESGLGYVKLTLVSDETAALVMIDQGWQVNETAILKYNNGTLAAVVLTDSESPPPAPSGHVWTPSAAFPISSSLGSVYMWFTPLEAIGFNVPSAPEPPEFPRFAKNPAHMILERHIQQHSGRQPRSSVNLDHLTVAADWFFSRGFGLCTTRNSKDESPRAYIKRIEKVAGCSFTKSLDDGLWYLDVANGIYDLETLEVINDDHVLKFKETGTVPDNAVNSVSVKYFDPERKETIISPPVRAMGLIAQFGEIHQTFDFPEVPIGRIALEIATRELLARITPTRTFELDCNPGVYRLRKNQPVRLQLIKRGIADMVCIVGDIPTSGSLKSGAFQLKLTQDIYSLPTTEYVVELGEDTRPPTTPAEIVSQIAFEAPYIDVVASMPAADFAALPADAGYVLGAAVDPGRMRDFTMMVAPDGGDYDDVGDGQFCPSCTSTGTVQPGLQEGIGFNNPSRMASVQVGDVGWWEGELVRVDAKDLDANTLDLGRGCGDTLPMKHDPGTRIFFYQSTAAFDRTQHIAGEALDVKLLTNSYSQQLDLVDATELPVTMAQRIDRPYNNGKMEINGVSIFAIGTSTPGGGGGGGPGGGGPTAPPAQSPGGGPASPVPGPNGGFPDDAPYPIPQPPVGGDVIDDGGFDTPGYPTGWTNADGTPLDSRWFVGSDGKLHYQGVGSSRAYYLPARFSLPWQPVPRYDIAAEADIATDSLVKAAVGAAWGVSTSGGGVAYESVSEMKSYPVEQTVPHSFIYAPSGLVAGFIYTGLIPIVTFVPVLIVESDSGLVVNATFDNVAITPTIIPMPTTPEPLPNLDFSSGLDEWSLYPDPTGNEHAPTIAVSGGELSMTTNSPFWKLQNFIHDTPLSLNDIGRYTGTTYEGWSNDTTVINGVTQGGAIVGFAGKYLGAVTGIVYSGAFQRGDWTERETWLRQHVDGSVPGLTLHHLCALRAEPTFTSAIRNQVVRTTDDIIDPVPIP